MGGYVTNNSVPTVTGAYLSNASRLIVDTQLPQGGSPQTGGIVVGTVQAPAAQIGLTALAGGAKAAATQLGYGLNTTTVVASDGDSVLLPYAFPGATVEVWNLDAAQDIRIYGKGTDVVNGVATGTGNLVGQQIVARLTGVTGTGDGTDAGSWVMALTTLP